MNRRELLKSFRDFCILNGISNIISPLAFGATIPTKKRFVSFVIKYTGGGTETSGNGVGRWNFESMLSPLTAYKNQMCFPMGLDCEFTVPLNTHAAPQVCALTGSTTKSVFIQNNAGTCSPSGRDCYFATSELVGYSTGEGKSIDVLIGEKLKTIHGCQLPNIQITNSVDTNGVAASHSQSSFGAGGKLLPTFSGVGDLAQDLKRRINCSTSTTPPSDANQLNALNRKLAALDAVKSNSTIFNSNYLVNKENFDNLTSKIQEAKGLLTSSSGSGTTVGATRPPLCDNFSTYLNYRPLGSSYFSADPNIAISARHKMNAMYDLAIAALQANVTRSLTFNLYSIAHVHSHFLQNNTLDKYLNVSTAMQQSIADFLGKLKAANLYDDTLVFCNAGSAMTNECHNYSNISNYVINGDKTGVIGSPSVVKPMGSLLLDILHKFDITYDRYGGTNHKRGIARKGNYI